MLWYTKQPLKSGLVFAVAEVFYQSWTQLADFGLAHASRTGTISFEAVNTDIRGTPGEWILAGIARTSA
jgi:hypothetical protein